MGLLHKWKLVFHVFCHLTQSVLQEFGDLGGVCDSYLVLTSEAAIVAV